MRIKLVRSELVPCLQLQDVSQDVFGHKGELLDLFCLERGVCVDQWQLGGSEVAKLLSQATCFKYIAHYCYLQAQGRTVDHERSGS